MMIKSHVFRGKRWKVRVVRIKDLGDCEAPNALDKLIRILPGKTRTALDIAIHEALHACLWDLDDEAVAETATCITKLLWKLEWRKAN